MWCPEQGECRLRTQMLFSEFDLGKEICRLGALTEGIQLRQDAGEVLRGVVCVDGGLVLPDLNKRQRGRIADPLIEGIGDVALLGTGLS